MAEMGAAVPADMAARLEAAGDPESVRQTGTEMATVLCQHLLDAGAPGLHFYTLNRSLATREIYANLGLAAPVPVVFGRGRDRLPARAIVFPQEAGRRCGQGGRRPAVV